MLIIFALVLLISGLFYLGFKVRTSIERLSFEINSANKDPQKGLQWYQDQITRQVESMRYNLIEDRPGRKHYVPWGIYSIMEGPVLIKFDAYSIEINASRMMMRILLDLVEISPK